MRRIVNQTACCTFRLRAGFQSVGAAARASGVPARTIGRLEGAARRSVAVSVLEQLADVYGCAVEDLMVSLPPRADYEIDPQALQRFRKACGWSLDDLALNAQVAFDTLRRWERGSVTTGIDLNCLRAVAQALSVDYPALLRPKTIPP